jgi:hypothetical protein
MKVTSLNKMAGRKIQFFIVGYPNLEAKAEMVKGQQLGNSCHKILSTIVPGVKKDRTSFNDGRPDDLEFEQHEQQSRA